MKIWTLFLIPSVLFSASLAIAEEVSTDFNKPLGDRIRFLSISEFMTPSVSSSSPFVPDSFGKPLTPSNISGYHWIDFEIMKDRRLVYWQRAVVELAGATPQSGPSARLLDPRFAFRWTQVIPDQHFSTLYDVYIQPGVTSQAADLSRVFDLGFRTNTTYSFPHSKFEIGLITDASASFYKSVGTKSNYFSGFLNPFATYNLTKTVSIRQWITAPFAFTKGLASNVFSMDSPFIQNGMAWVITPGVWLHAYVNNYLDQAPTLKNTWASVWLVFYKM